MIRLIEDQEREEGRKVKLMRAARHGNQRKIASEIGVSQSRISRWETGTSVPDLMELMRFAHACNAHPEQLIEGIIVPKVEQMRMELDVCAADAVGGLIQILHERPLASAPIEPESAEAPGGAVMQPSHQVSS